jgi:hypothetical protein
VADETNGQKPDETKKQEPEEVKNTPVLSSYKCTADCFWSNNRYYKGKTYKLPGTPPAEHFKKCEVKAETK